MGLEDIRARLDGYVSVGIVPEGERDSVRAQVDELAMTDPAGADSYRTALARLDPRLFPSADAAALGRRTGAMLQADGLAAKLEARIRADLDPKKLVALVEGLEETRSANGGAPVFPTLSFFGRNFGLLQAIRRLTNEQGRSVKRLAVFGAGSDSLHDEIGEPLEWATLFGAEVDVYDGNLRVLERLGASEHFFHAGIGEEAGFEGFADYLSHFGVGAGAIRDLRTRGIPEKYSYPDGIDERVRGFSLQFLTQPVPDKKYDLIACLNVFRHLRQPDQDGTLALAFLIELLDSLSPDGTLVTDAGEKLPRLKLDPIEARLLGVRVREEDHPALVARKAIRVDRDAIPTVDTKRYTIYEKIGDGTPLLRELAALVKTQLRKSEFPVSRKPPEAPVVAPPSPPLPKQLSPAGRLLRALAPLRPVSRESVEDQGFMLTSALFSYSALTPALRGLLTGEFPWLTPGQLAMTAAVTAVASVPAIYYLMPYGKISQNREDPGQNRIGRRTVIEAETLHTIVFMHFLGGVFGWDPLITLWNAAWQGLTKGFPLSQIYRRWGDERRGLWLRQGAMVLMMTDQAVASSVASAGSSGVSVAQMGWVAAFNLLLGKALALIPEGERTKSVSPEDTLKSLRTDLATLWEQTREARARYQVPSHTEVLQDGSPTMLICERLIQARMKETGLERKNITVVVAGHDGVSAEVGVWLKLGVTVVAVEIDVCNGALRTSLEEQVIDVSRLILKPIESREIPKGDIVLWNFPGMTDRYIWEYPAVMGNPLKPGGILVVQTENRWLELQLEFSRRWKMLLVDSRITPSNHLLPSQYMPTLFGRAALLILKDRLVAPVALAPAVAVASDIGFSPAVDSAALLPDPPAKTASPGVAPEVATLQRLVAEEMAAHPELFAPNQCHFTVRDFLLRHIPRDRLSHVRVLCIRKKGGGDVIGGRGALKPNETLGDFQTTIEIGGRIYGYWYRGRPGVSIDTYVSEMFPKEDLDDLTVLSIPAQEYVDYPDAAEALPYFWQRDDRKVVPLRDYVHAAMARYGHQHDFEDIENRLETYERFTATVDVRTSDDGSTIRYNGGSGFTPAIFSQKLRSALGSTEGPLTPPRQVQLTVFVSADAVVGETDIQQVATRELEQAGYSGPVSVRLFQGPHASTRLFSVEPATAHPDPGPGTDGVPSPVLLAGGDFLAGGDWLAATGLADYDLSWVPRSAAVIGGLALFFGGLVAVDRYRTYKSQRDQLYRHLETWPEVRAVMHDALKAFRGNDALPDWQVKLWRRKPNIVEHHFRMALAVSGMLRSLIASSQATLTNEVQAETGVPLREWAKSLTDLMNDLRGSFPPEVWRIYRTAALEKLGLAIGSLKAMINEQLCRIAEEEDSRVRRLALLGKVTPAAGERIKLGRSILQLLNRAIEEFEWDMIKDSLQILLLDGNSDNVPVVPIGSARTREIRGTPAGSEPIAREVEELGLRLLSLLKLLHVHPERTIPLEKIFRALGRRATDTPEGSHAARIRRVSLALKSHLEALTLVYEGSPTPSFDDNISWRRIFEIVAAGDAVYPPFKIDRNTWQFRTRDLHDFRMESPEVQLVIENTEKLGIERRNAFLEKFSGKPLVLIFDPKQKIDASKLALAKEWVKVMVGETLGIDPRRIEVVPTFYTAGLVNLAAARREGRTPRPVTAGRPTPLPPSSIPRPSLRVVRNRPPRDDDQGSGGDGGPTVAVATELNPKPQNPNPNVIRRRDVPRILSEAVVYTGADANVALAEEVLEPSLRGRNDRNNLQLELVRSPRRPADGRTPRDDVLKRQLILLAQSRGLVETATLIARLTEEQVRKLVGQSHRWREILMKRGMGDTAEQLAQAAPLSATDRILLILAAASGSQKAVQSLAERIVGSRKAPQAALGFSPSRFAGPLSLPGGNPGTLLLTK